MSRLFVPIPPRQTKLDGTGYELVIDTIAPGMLVLVRKHQHAYESWTRTLIRLMISISLTDDQRILLIEMARNFDDGFIAPYNMQEAIERANTPAFPRFLTACEAVHAPLMPIQINRRAFVSQTVADEALVGEANTAPPPDFGEFVSALSLGATALKLVGL